MGLNCLQGQTGNQENYLPRKDGEKHRGAPIYLKIFHEHNFHRILRLLATDTIKPSDDMNRSMTNNGVVGLIFPSPPDRAGSRTTSETSHRADSADIPECTPYQAARKTLIKEINKPVFVRGLQLALS